MAEFNDQNLHKAVAQGMTMREMAKEFNKNPSTISRHMKRLRLSRVSQAAAQAGITLQDDIDAQEELKKLYKRAEHLLCLLESVLSGEKDFSEVQGLLGKKPLHDALTDTWKELRNQINLMKEISLALYNERQVKEFQQVVMDEIRKENPDTAQRIVRRLVQYNAMYNCLEPQN
jgi:IS30 family transposase